MGGAVVQPMIGAGVEVVVGVEDDPSFGPLVRFGMGGFGAELQGDAVHRVVPLTDVDAHDMVRGLRSSPLLFGYRGTPRADADRLADLLVRVGRLADEVPELGGLELDPVIASPHGVVVADAKVHVAPMPAAPEVMTRRMRPASRSADGQDSSPSSAQSVANASS
jgi:acyl-CoA synthetase (NDP forming)